MFIMLARHFQNFARKFHMRRKAHDLFDRAFANQDLLVLVVFQNDRHAAALKIKRQFVDLAKLFIHLKRFVQVAVIQNGFIHQVLQASLIITVHISVMQNALAFIAARVNMLFKNNFALRQRPRFIGAKHICCAKILDGVQAFDDHLFARHHDCAVR